MKWIENIYRENYVNSIWCFKTISCYLVQFMETDTENLAKLLVMHSSTALLDDIITFVRKSHRISHGHCTSSNNKSSYMPLSETLRNYQLWNQQWYFRFYSGSRNSITRMFMCLTLTYCSELEVKKWGQAKKLGIGPNGSFFHRLVSFGVLRRGTWF